MLHISAFVLTRAPGLGQNDTEPQYSGGLGDELGESSSVQQSAEEESGELDFLLGEPHDCIQTPTDAAVGLLKQAKSNPQNIRGKLLQLAGQLAGECHHSASLKRWDPKDPKANTSRGKLKAQVVADVDIEVRLLALAKQQLYQYRVGTRARGFGVSFVRADANNGRLLLRLAPLSSQRRATTSRHTTLT